MVGLSVLKIEKLERSLDVSEYIKSYRDIERFEALCRECPNYGARWGCPPFNEDFQLHLYRMIDIVLLKVELSAWEAPDGAALMAALHDVVTDVRGRFEPDLLRREKETGGLAALFTGMCPHCPSVDCARKIGRPCRHPQWVRPSLEALGFDLERTASEVFGIDMLWAEKNKAPDRLCLIGALFHG